MTPVAGPVGVVGERALALPGRPLDLPDPVPGVVGSVPPPLHPEMTALGPAVAVGAARDPAARGQSAVRVEQVEVLRVARALR